MISVTQFAQHLLKLDPQKNIARLSFYHFLKNFYDLEAEFKPSVIDDFYARILTFQYWQNHARFLASTIRDDLQSFVEQNSLTWELSQIKHCDEFQALNLQHQDSLETLVRLKFTKDPSHQNSHHRFLWVSPAQIMALILSPSHNLTVHTYSNTVLIKNGQLHLLAPVSSLFYNSYFELIPNQVQTLECPTLTWIRFQLTDEGCQGLMIQGHSFQKQQCFLGGHLSQHPELFYNLKKLEKYYINPQSDPFYQELISMLEKAHQMLHSNHPDATRLGKTALQKGQLALKNIFPHDKLLLLLVSNIEHWLNKNQESVTNYGTEDFLSPLPKEQTSN